MQHYSSVVPPVRTTTSTAHYGPSVEGKKTAVMPAARLPIAGRVTVPSAPSAAPGGVSPIAAQVANVPTPTNTKVQPQMQHLPRFQPPTFEGANGALPCPDSPGSTPRSSRGERRDSLGGGGGSGGGEPRQRDSSSSAVVRPHAQPTTINRERDQAAESSPSQPPTQPPPSRSPESPGAIAVGTYVEYKSRSSGHWILAKVEGFDEGTQTYKLDVQPHAQPERVRRRLDKNGANNDRGNAERPSDATARAQAPALVDSTEECFAPPDRPVASGPSSSLPNGSSALPTRAILRDPPPTAALDPSSPRIDFANDGRRGTVDFTAAGEVDYPELLAESEAASRRMHIELESLKTQVSRQQCEIDELNERVSQEAALKDRYFSELCICHEQIQRLRTTPR